MLCQRVAELPVWQAARQVAAYIAIRGEIDVGPLLESGARAGKQFYLPVLRGEQMRFAPWQPGELLQKRGFGLLEPDCSEDQYCSPDSLDLVLAPLVVFDARCNRVGQGGGYYDRTFAFRRKSSSNPVLLGVAHQCQHVEQLKPQPWDVQLDCVATEQRCYQSDQFT